MLSYASLLHRKSVRDLYGCRGLFSLGIKFKFTRYGEAKKRHSQKRQLKKVGRPSGCFDKAFLIAMRRDIFEEFFLFSIAIILRYTWHITSSCWCENMVSSLISTPWKNQSESLATIVAYWISNDLNILLSCHLLHDKRQ